MLYDAGESFTKKGICQEDARAEHGAFLYRFIPAQMGKMRKMDILIPTVKKSAFGISKLAMGEQGEEEESEEEEEQQQQNGKVSKPSKAAGPKKPIADIGLANIFNLDGKVEVDEKEILQHLKKERTTVYQQIPNRPMSEGQTLTRLFREKAAINGKYYIFQDKKPYFNPKTCQYSFDFHGRVKESSIKNF